jgi:pseudaminic acid synthase
MHGDKIRIAGRNIGSQYPPFIIAEISGNHNGTLDRALQIVEAAAKAGAHAVKLQTYTADTMTLNLSHGEFFIRDPKSLWSGSSLYDLYQKAHTPWDWHPAIFKRCRELGLIAFSTPFDATAVEFLESLEVPCYKVASFENTDLPLIRKVSATGKPVIISTGMASDSEIDEAVKAAREAGCKDLILLKCTSTYPATPESSNIRTIPDMSERFGVPVGLSDHTMGIGVAIASVAQGACAIEKHFTLSRNDGGVDSAFSSEPDELNRLVEESDRAWRSLGTVSYGPTEAEKESLRYRRSLYIVEDLKPGDVLTTRNVRAIRPGLGLPPKHLDEIIGKQVAKPVSKGTPLSWEILE